MKQIVISSKKTFPIQGKTTGIKMALTHQKLLLGSLVILFVLASLSFISLVLFSVFAAYL